VRWPLLLPIFATVIVAAGIVSALLVDAEPGGLQRRSQGDAEPTATAVVRQPSGGDVCQGVSARPQPGQPQVFSSHYTKRAEANGLTIVASDGVDDVALDKAQETIADMFAENGLEEMLAAQGAYVVIADGNENILDLPEFRCLDEEDRRAANAVAHACGVADRADYPIVTVNERDLLGDRRGPCSGLNILYHELGHLVQGWAIDPQDYFDIKLFYQNALNEGLYRDDYASTNSNEYFAEGTQAYFLASDPRGRHDRAWLEEYDPDLFALLDRVYGG
jgi:alpha-glucosidase